MEHYVTLFDSLFLPQGLALHRSMERHIKNYVLWILCVDDEVHDVLTSLRLNNVHLLQLSKLENEDLLRVKPTRSKGEYCWTLTPFAPFFVFESDESINTVTYLDADTWFRRSPKEIHRELDSSCKSVLITEHAYAPEYDHSYLLGRFCVQYMVFKKPECYPVLNLWKKQCLEWCHAYPNNNRFGDQKYLDDWPNQFDNIVHILNNKELIMAPWNASRFPYGNCAIWHFHGLRINSSQKTKKASIILGSYPLPRVVMEYIYKPYINDLRESLDNLREVQYIAKNQFNLSVRNTLQIIFSSIYHRFFSYKFLNLFLSASRTNKN